ncbi:MAG: formyltransferase family protein [Rhodospirillales bacterium]
MPHEIGLLTGKVEGPHLTSLLLARNPALNVTHLVSRDDLLFWSTFNPDGGFRRLVAFCTNIIVPAAVLAALPGPSYNFHPGPPEYPGVHSVQFALAEGADKFGVTLHEMAPKVDEGTIIDVRRFDIQSDADGEELEIDTFLALLGQFDDLADWLANRDDPLPSLGIQWSGRKYRKRDYEALCQSPPPTGSVDFTRWHRAVQPGEGA